MSDQQVRDATSAGVTYALGAYGIWGIAPAYWKLLGAVTPAQLLAHRVVWSMVFGILLLAVTRRAREYTAVLRSRRLLLTMLLSALLIGTNWFVFLWAVDTDRVLDTSLGYYINPLISVVFGMIFLGERLRPFQAVAVLLAAAGVLQMAVSLGTLPWISLVLAVSFALYGLVRKTAPVMPVVGFTIETSLLAPLAGAYLVVVDSRSEAADLSPQLALLLVGAGPFTAAPLLCFNSAAKRLRLATLGLIQYIAPSIAFLLAVAVYGEPFTRAHAVTFGCVWLALAIYSLDSARRPRSLKRPDEALDSAAPIADTPRPDESGPLRPDRPGCEPGESMQRESPLNLRAVIFDLGGVILGSPLHAIASFEREQSIDSGAINRIVVTTGPGGAWARLERGELSMEDFFVAFEADCAAAGWHLSARELMERIGETAEPRPDMLEAVRRIRARGLHAAALTNNWVGDETGTDALKPHFDVFVESSLLRLRKPDPRIYHHACEAIGIAPGEAVFLDDIGRNLKAARELGMATIKVDDPVQALRDLEQLLGFELLDA